MLSLSVVRSLILRDETEHPNSLAKASRYLSRQPTWKRLTSSTKIARKTGGCPYLVFVPTEEVMRDQLRVTAIAREMGMEFCGDLINGRLIYSWPDTAVRESVCLPFPHITDARLHQLHQFVTLSRGMFRVDNLPPKNRKPASCPRRGSLSVRLSREAVDGMEKFSRVLAGGGWSVFKVIKSAAEEMFVYRKVDYKLRLQWDGSNPRPSPAFRVRELLLPRLDLTSAPTEILEYILLMTDDLFYLTHKSPVGSFSASK